MLFCGYQSSSHPVKPCLFRTFSHHACRRCCRLPVSSTISSGSLLPPFPYSGRRAASFTSATCLAPISDAATNLRSGLLICQAGRGGTARAKKKSKAPLSEAELLRKQVNQRLPISSRKHVHKQDTRLCTYYFLFTLHASHFLLGRTPVDQLEHKLQALRFSWSASCFHTCYKPCCPAIPFTAKTCLLSHSCCRTSAVMGAALCCNALTLAVLATYHQKSMPSKRCTDSCPR